MWNSLLVTIAAGTPVVLAAIPTAARRLIVTPMPAGTGIVYVVSVPENSVASVARTNNNTVTVIGPATASAPATPFRQDRTANDPPIMINGYQIDGSHTADTVLVSWELP